MTANVMPKASRSRRGAARRLEPLDTRLARDTYRDALGAAVLAGGFADGAGVLEVARAVRAAPKPTQDRPGDLLLDSLAVFGPAADSLALEPADGLTLALDGPFGEALAPWLPARHCRPAPASPITSRPDSPC